MIIRSILLIEVIKNLLVGKSPAVVLDPVLMIRSKDIVNVARS